MANRAVPERTIGEWHNWLELAHKAGTKIGPAGMGCFDQHRDWVGRELPPVWLHSRDVLRPVGRSCWESSRARPGGVCENYRQYAGGRQRVRIAVSSSLAGSNRLLD